MGESHAGPGATGNESLTRLAVGLAGAAVVAMIVLAAAGADGAIWIVQGALAAAAAVVAWRAGGATRRNAVAFGALIVGTLLFLVFVAFAIAEG